MNHDLNGLEKELLYTFKNKELLQEALIHTSYAYEHNLESSNERLELLGDAVLHLVLTDYLMREYPEENEGQLSALRSFCESAPFLHNAAFKLNLGKYLSLGRGEETSGGRLKESLLANTFEAVIAAVYTDGGFKKAGAFILRHIKKMIKRAHDEELHTDSKLELQKLTQQFYNNLPQYRIVQESGPEHEKKFIVSVVAGGVTAEGLGRNKKSAEKDAAKNAIYKLRSKLSKF